MIPHFIDSFFPDSFYSRCERGRLLKRFHLPRQSNWKGPFQDNGQRKRGSIENFSFISTKGEKIPRKRILYILDRGISKAPMPFHRIDHPAKKFCKPFSTGTSLKRCSQLANLVTLLFPNLFRRVSWILAFFQRGGNTEMEKGVMKENKYY